MAKLTAFEEKMVRDALVPLKNWKPFPAAADRSAWDRLLAAQQIRRRSDYLCGMADGELGRAWPPLPATLYMDFAREGIRTTYQEPCFERRHRLAVLALAECFDGRGRYLDEILNGLWAILEESTWCVPAHLGAPLPDPDLPAVDLFACETAATVSLASYLLAERLDGLSPVIRRRIRREVMARVVEPVAERDDFWWLKGRNNWTPWCASNILLAAFCLEDDAIRLSRLTWKLMQAVDRFIAGYGPDGGCDEGPSYWGVAGGALLVFLELLDSRTGGKISIWSDPLIREMGRFIATVHLDGPWFFNFGDGSAQAHPPLGATWRYGERVGLEEMKSVAWEVACGGNPEMGLPVNRPVHSLYRELQDLFWVPADAHPAAADRPQARWLSDLQILVARETSRPGQGLVLAAKAGHNDASHNHNDIGQFVIWLDGEPVIVDVGVETYTRKTFSSERYSLWTIRSSSHNVPLINGIEQVAGRQHSARDVRAELGDQSASLYMDLAGAYPGSANLVEARREVRLDRRPAGAVRIRDRIETRCGPLTVAVPLFSPAEISEDGTGRIRFRTARGAACLEYDPSRLTARIETVELSDRNLRSCWGPRLARLTLEARSSESSVSYEFAVSRAADSGAARAKA